MSKERDLQIYKSIRELLIAVDHCDANKAIIATMVEDKIEILEHYIEKFNEIRAQAQKSINVINQVPCPHNNIESWNHGYHNRCRDCGEEDVSKF